jgi:putative transposase
MKRYEPPAGWTVQAYRFALDPRDEQIAGLRRNTGAARFVYNHMLRRVSAVRAQRAAEASYGVAGAELTPWQGWSLPDLRRTWNAIKRWVAPWWAECSKEAFNTGLANLSAALGNWRASRTGARKGRRMGWPRTKRKHDRRSARFTTGAIRVDFGYRHVVLPRLGRIRTRESTRKLGRRVRVGTATIAGRAYVPLHRVRAVLGPGRQRRTQSRRARAARRPGVAGRRKNRTWSLRKTRKTWTSRQGSGP